MGEVRIDKTNPVNMEVVHRVAVMDKIEAELGLKRLGFSSQVELPHYDESNTRYQELEKVESEASELIAKGEQIPDKLRKFLLDTRKERENWHAYCSRHYRKPKLTEEEMLMQLESIVNN